MVSVDCQLAGTQNEAGDKPPGTPLRDHSDGANLSACLSGIILVSLRETRRPSLGSTIPCACILDAERDEEVS